ncbi:MAG: phenylacetate--CoA ligase family protein, partial [Aquificota bacterium]
MEGAMDVDVRIRKTLALAWERCPALRRRMEEAGLALEDIRGEEELARIPVLKKDQLGVLQTQAPPFGGLLAVDVKELARIFVSPGPIFDPQGAVPDYWRRAQALEAAGFGPGDLVVN